MSASSSISTVFGVPFTPSSSLSTKHSFKVSANSLLPFHSSSASLDGHSTPIVICTIETKTPDILSSFKVLDATEVVISSDLSPHFSHSLRLHEDIPVTYFAVFALSNENHQEGKAREISENDYMGYCVVNTKDLSSMSTNAHHVVTLPLKNSSSSVVAKKLLKKGSTMTIQYDDHSNSTAVHHSISHDTTMLSKINQLYFISDSTSPPHRQTIGNFRLVVSSSSSSSHAGHSSSHSFIISAENLLKFDISSHSNPLFAIFCDDEKTKNLTNGKCQWKLLDHTEFQMDCQEPTFQRKINLTNERTEQWNDKMSFKLAIYNVESNEIREGNLIGECFITMGKLSELDHKSQNSLSLALTHSSQSLQKKLTKKNSKIIIRAAAPEKTNKSSAGASSNTSATSAFVLDQKMREEKKTVDSEKEQKFIENQKREGEEKEIEREKKRAADEKISQQLAEDDATAVVAAAAASAALLAKEQAERERKEEEKRREEEENQEKQRAEAEKVRLAKEKEDAEKELERQRVEKENSEKEKQRVEKENAAKEQKEKEEREKRESEERERLEKEKEKEAAEKAQKAERERAEKELADTIALEAAAAAATALVLAEKEREEKEKAEKEKSDKGKADKEQQEKEKEKAEKDAADAASAAAAAADENKKKEKDQKSSETPVSDSESSSSSPSFAKSLSLNVNLAVSPSAVDPMSPASATPRHLAEAQKALHAEAAQLQPNLSLAKVSQKDNSNKKNAKADSSKSASAAAPANDQFSSIRESVLKRRGEMGLANAKKGEEYQFVLSANGLEKTGAWTAMIALYERSSKDSPFSAVDQTEPIRDTSILGSATFEKSVIAEYYDESEELKFNLFNVSGRERVMDEDLVGAVTVSFKSIVDQITSSVPIVEMKFNVRHPANVAYDKILRSRGTSITIKASKVADANQDSSSSSSTMSHTGVNNSAKSSAPASASKRDRNAKKSVNLNATETAKMVSEAKKETEGSSENVLTPPSPSNKTATAAVVPIPVEEKKETVVAPVAAAVVAEKETTPAAVQSSSSPSPSPEVEAEAESTESGDAASPQSPVAATSSSPNNNNKKKKKKGKK